MALPLHRPLSTTQPAPREAREWTLGIPGIRKAEDLMGPVRRIREYCLGRLQDCLQPGLSTEQLLARMDDISNNLCSAMDLAHCIRQTHPQSHYRAVAWKTLCLLQPLLVRVNTSAELYDALRTSDPATIEGDEELLTMRSAFLRDLCLHGVDRGLVDSVAMLNHDVDYLARAFEGVARRPSDCHETRASELSNTAEEQMDTVREGLGEQTDALQRLLHKRHQLASTLGFPNFASLALAGRSVKAPEAVLSYLCFRADSIRPGFEALLRRLDCGSRTVGEFEYRAARWRSENPSGGRGGGLQFSLEQVLSGFAGMARDLVSVEVKVEECKFPWSRGMLRLRLHDLRGEGADLGIVYLDLKQRDGKSSSPTHYTLRGRRRTSPTENLLYGLADGEQSAISLVSAALDDLAHIPFGAAQTVFHELGHALHNCLSDTRYQTLSGTRGSMETAELPATITELYFSEPDFQARYMGLTGRQKEQFEGVAETMAMFRPWHQMGVIQDALVDILLHSSIPKKNHALDREELLRAQTDATQLSGGLKPSQDSNVLTLGRNHHLGSYGCSFYTYVLSHDLAEQFMRGGPDRRGTLRGLLERGGLLSLADAKGAVSR